jgi:hypothetical protein
MLTKSHKLLMIVLTIAMITSVAGIAPAQEIPTAELPVVSVAPGLAPEIEMIRILAQRINLEVTTNTMAEPADLTKDGNKLYNTMIIAIGGSGKGLGAAGVSIEDEMARAERLIAKAKELKMFLIGIHVGGSARRGPNTEKLLPIVVPNMNYVIVRKDGNEDGIFTKLTSENKIPLTEIEKTTELMDILKKVFNLP